MLEKVLAALLGASWVYWLAACWLVRDFFHRAGAEAGRRAGAEAGPGTSVQPSFRPPVSVLKPVRGVDRGAYENFVSHCRQDYPEYEIIFGVAEADDPVVPLIRRLQRDFPERSIRLIVAPPFGPNRKACLLHELVKAARYDVLVMNDSDMRVTPDYLARVVQPLADPKVGLVTCPYVGGDVRSLPAALEALHMGVTFLPSVVVARKAVNMRFALGASITMRRADLERLGGFAALKDYLAEDFQVGYQTASKLGLRVHLSDYIITCVLGDATFHEQWSQELRWMRCNRVSRPREYPGLVLTHSTALAAALALVSGFSEAASQALLVTLVLRWAVAWLVTGYTGDRVSRRYLLWLPVRDILSALVWVAGGLGRRVSWRGEEYRLEPGGKIRPLRMEDLLEDGRLSALASAAHGLGPRRGLPKEGGLGGESEAGDELEGDGGLEGEPFASGDQGSGPDPKAVLRHS